MSGGTNAQETAYGSDLAVRALEHLGIRNVALNPGASFRGLHESLVHAGTVRPIMGLSENAVVALAHGYAKAALKPMCVVLHNLVGLQSGAMGIFNAWVDQVPMLVLGGSGPADRSRRRPYIDWIHSARPQATVIRDHVKWDDEPTSLDGWPESLAQAYQLAVTAPCGPTYVALDALLQEAAVGDRPPALVELPPPPRLSTPQADLDRVVAALGRAERPLILADHVGRSEAAFDALVRLAGRTGARVVDLGGRHSFPSTHPADGTAHRTELLTQADLVLALDVRDLRWAITAPDVDRRSFRPLVAPTTPVLALGLGELLRRGFMEQEGIVPGAERLVGDTAVVLPELARLVAAAGSAPATGWDPLPPPPEHRMGAPDGPITRDDLLREAWDAVRDGPWQLAQGRLGGRTRTHWDLERFNCHLGTSGGAGLGYGAGATMGAALAHDDDDTLVVAFQPDGDFLYTASALWTAAHESLALLTIVVNNRTYGQDRMHQLTMSRLRGRPAEHAVVGIDIDDPPVDFAGLARAQGVEGIGPVTTVGELGPVLRRAVAAVREEHRPLLVDVVVP